MRFDMDDGPRVWSLRLTAGQGLHHVDAGVRGYGIGQSYAVAYGAAVDEYHHVAAQGALVVENVATRRGVAGECGVEDLAHGLPGGDAGGAGQMPLNILREGDLCHEWP